MTAEPIITLEAIIILIVGFFGGSLVGAVLTLLVTKRWRRVEIAIDLIKTCISMKIEFATVNGLLRTNPTLDAVEQNQVRKVGDWLDLAANLWDQHHAHRSLLQDSVVFTEMANFRNFVNAYKARADELADAGRWWPNLYKLTLGA